MNTRLPLIFFMSISLGGSALLFAHEGEEHSAETDQAVMGDDGFEVISKEPTKNQTQMVNALYLKHVKPIFKEKCLDCHGSGNPLPWYSNIPGPKQLIEEDMREAKKHMDMSEDIPFSGHGTLKDDLTAIEEVMKDNSMPPFRYKIMHWNSGLSEDEKVSIQKWIEKSRVILNK